MQYFAWYIHPSRMQFGVGSPTIIADWKANEGNRRTVPVGLAIGRLLKIPKMPVEVSLEASYSVAHPESCEHVGLFFPGRLPVNIHPDVPSHK